VISNDIEPSLETKKPEPKVAPETPTKVGAFRNGQGKTITVTLGQFPRASSEAKAEEQKARSEPAALGLTLAPASAIAGASEHGVVIIEIDPSGRAAESGLQTADVISTLSTVR
jgi:serine protease Do